MTRVAFLGPAGTFNHEALLTAAAGQEVEEAPAPTVIDAIRAVQDGGADRALVPFENSIEGSVRATLDALAFECSQVALVGEVDHPIRHSLIARTQLSLGEVEVVLSHAHATAQCARFLRERLPGAEIRTVASTAEAVRLVGAGQAGWAALGPEAAADRYGCVVLGSGVEDEADNVTRFVWVAPAGTRSQAGERWKTTLVISELSDHPGALVELLQEFSLRDVNLSRIESRPLRLGLGRYLFFLDLEGSATDPDVAEALDAVRSKAESVRLLGSYPLDVQGVPG